jgi:prolyl-tRNA editing enzyme YbaK/EbsC (Cys-tRNA(Pro) deacylase)
MDLPDIYINGGRRGLLVRIGPAVLESLLPVTRVDVAIPPA